jgi:hypothetical protein
MVMRYCRFFWPCLIAIWQDIKSGTTPYALAKNTWDVGRAAIVRAADLQSIVGPWIENLHRELTNGKAIASITLQVKIVTAKIGHIELMHRWYCHRYPKRCFAQ